MLLLGQILLTVGTLIVVVPTRDGVVIVADSKSSRRTTAGAGTSTSLTEKVFSLPGVPGTAFFVTGISPIEWVPDGGGIATVVDARGVVTARLSRRGHVTRDDFDAVADECARLAARLHRMGDLAVPLVGRELFTVVMVAAGSGATSHEVASFVVRLGSRGADVSRREWQRFGPSDGARVMMYGEGAFVGAGLPHWTGGSAGCARQFLGGGERLVSRLDASAAARGAYSILEAASTAMGADGTVGPPFRAYVLTLGLTELPPVAPCR
ncbi:MAG: hypothetical protein M3Q55_10330 [Acidobacteriota bacterium]|nr:hypothetical protein [Acidobacteriota bacterium]